jgi:hypothetical protein
VIVAGCGSKNENPPGIIQFFEGEALLMWWKNKLKPNVILRKNNQGRSRVGATKRAHRMLQHKSAEMQQNGAKLAAYCKFVIVLESFQLNNIPSMSTPLYDAAIHALQTNKITLDYSHCEAILLRSLQEYVVSEGVHVEATVNIFWDKVWMISNDATPVFDLLGARLCDLPTSLKNKASLFQFIICSLIVKALIDHGDTKAQALRHFITFFLAKMELVDIVALDDWAANTLNDVAAALSYIRNISKHAVTNAQEEYGEVEEISKLAGSQSDSAQTLIANAVHGNAYWSEE